MLHQYYLRGPRGEICFAKCLPQGGHYWLLRTIYVEHSCRRLGIGQRLLDWVIYDADYGGHPLVLYVQPFGHNPIVRDEILERWYAKNGFHYVRTFGITSMRRYPGQPQPPVLESHWQIDWSNYL